MGSEMRQYELLTDDINHLRMLYVGPLSHSPTKVMLLYVGAPFPFPY
jgi:hypothetical protein